MLGGQCSRREVNTRRLELPACGRRKLFERFLRCEIADLLTLSLWDLRLSWWGIYNKVIKANCCFVWEIIGSCIISGALKREILRNFPLSPTGTRFFSVVDPFSDTLSLIIDQQSGEESHSKRSLRLRADTFLELPTGMESVRKSFTEKRDPASDSNNSLPGPSTNEFDFSVAMTGGQRGRTSPDPVLIMAKRKTNKKA